MIRHTIISMNSSVENYVLWHLVCMMEKIWWNVSGWVRLWLQRSKHSFDWNVKSSDMYMYIFKDDSYIANQLFASDGEHMVICALIWYKVRMMMMMTQLNINHSNWTFSFDINTCSCVKTNFRTIWIAFWLWSSDFYLHSWKWKEFSSLQLFQSHNVFPVFFFLALSQNTRSDHWFSHKIENWYHCFKHCFQHYFLITRKVQTLDQIFAFGDFMGNWKYIFI